MYFAREKISKGPGIKQISSANQKGEEANGADEKRHLQMSTGYCSYFALSLVILGAIVWFYKESISTDSLFHFSQVGSAAG